MDGRVQLGDDAGANITFLPASSQAYRFDFSQVGNTANLIINGEVQVRIVRLKQTYHPVAPTAT